jgi:hypothetical protein
MKIKKSVYEISDVINMHPLEQTNLNFFKIFSLPVWLVIISISLSLASNSVNAGTEDTDLYYRYVPYQGPSSTTETGSQKPAQPSGASETEAKKAEQATSTGEKGGEAGQAAAGTPSQETTKPSEPSATAGTSGQAPASGSQGATGQSTQQGSQDANRQSTQQGSQGATDQSAQQANAPKTECPFAGEQKPPVQRSERNTGEFPLYPTFCQADVNGDHYITKDELQNFPELLRVFDKVDAGKDGKLEQHEFANLEMETSREGEI